MFPNARHPGRVLPGFLILLALYQAAEGVHTLAPSNPLSAVLMTLALVAAWPLGRWLGWRGYDAYGLEPQPGVWRLLAAMMALAFLAKGAGLGLGLATGAYATGGRPAPGFGSSAAAFLVAVAAINTFIPSVAEDILTRGFPLRTAGLRWSGPAFVAASAALYTANHIWRFGWGWSEQVRLFCLGLAYAAAAWRWRTLWAAVALHWGWNLAGATADTFLPLQPLDMQAARWTSAAVHLVLLAAVWLIPAPATTPREVEPASETDLERRALRQRLRRLGRREPRRDPTSALPS